MDTKSQRNARVCLEALAVLATSPRIMVASIDGRPQLVALRELLERAEELLDGKPKAKARKPRAGHEARALKKARRPRKPKKETPSPTDTMSELLEKNL